jgi:hypothetical protein
MHRMFLAVTAALTMFVATASAWQAANSGPYKVLKTVKTGGLGGFDYIYADPAGQMPASAQALRSSPSTDHPRSVRQPFTDVRRTPLVRTGNSSWLAVQTAGPLRGLAPRLSDVTVPSSGEWVPNGEFHPCTSWGPSWTMIGLPVCCLLVSRSA